MSFVLNVMRVQLNLCEQNLEILALDTTVNDRLSSQEILSKKARD